MKRKSIKPSPPVLVAWDFDACPPKELEHCLFYEYCKDSPRVRDIVEKYRRREPNWVNRPTVVVTNYREFPKKHWLEIPPKRRSKYVKIFQPRSKFLAPVPRPAMYELDLGDRALFEEQIEVWQIIKDEKAKLLDHFFNADSNALRKLLRLNKISTEGMNDAEVQIASGKLRVMLGKKIERKYRPSCERVFYEIDWQKRPVELVTEFKKWMKLNRVHEPRKRSGGHEAKPAEKLRALGAKRLLSFFRRPHDQWPVSYQKYSTEGAICEFVRDERKKAGRPSKDLYPHTKSLYGGEKQADKILASLDRL